jgi:CheY-like chemotaxis protein
MSFHVHVCDDEPHIVLAVSLKLSKAGLQVSTASDGQSAWEAMQQVRPQVVITDLQMPRLDGIALVERMRSHPDFRDVPVILLTAKSFELDHEELRRDLDIAYVVCKPFSPRELLKMVQSLLGVPVAVEE